MLLWILGFAFFLIVTAVVAVGWWLTQKPAPAPVVNPEPAPAPVVFDAQGEPAGESGLLEFTRTAGLLVPGGEKPDEALDKELLGAGFLHPGRQAYFRGVQALAGCGLAAVFTLSQALQGTGLSDSLMAAAAGLVLGFMVPQRALRWFARRRRDRIRAALPPAIDLLVLGLEAGHGLDHSMETVARELRKVHPELARELSLVPLHMRAGNSRSQVLDAMARRIKEPEFTRLVNVLSDGERFGASLAPALKNHSRYLRTRRRQSAQEQARKVSVKLVFPVFFLIFPAVLLVTLGPAVINLRAGLAGLLVK